MGILWTIWPTNDEMKEWLDSEGINYPDVESRFPTGYEIKDVLTNLKEYEINIIDNGIGNSWQASVHSRKNPEISWTLLNINEYSGNDKPQELWFEKGDEELIKDILKKLSLLCGPLVLMADPGGFPEVINA